MIKIRLKIPNGSSKVVIRRTTDNTHAKRKRTKDKQRYTEHYIENKD